MWGGRKLTQNNLLYSIYERQCIEAVDGNKVYLSSDILYIWQMVMIKPNPISLGTKQITSKYYRNCKYVNLCDHTLVTIKNQ